MPNRKELTPEEFQKTAEKAMSFSEFGQYVSNNIPYEKYVFGVGRISYTPILPQDSIVLAPDNGSGDLRQNPFFWGGTLFAGFSIYKSWLAFDQYNMFYWKGANGGRFFQDLISNPFIRNAATDYYKASANRAMELAKPLYKNANRLSYIGLVIPVVSTINNGEVNLEDTTDFIFAAVAFVPGVGWIISGIYAVADTVCVITTGEKISTHTQKKAFTKWVEFNNELRNWVNNMAGFRFY